MMATQKETEKLILELEEKVKQIMSEVQSLKESMKASNEFAQPIEPTTKKSSSNLENFIGLRLMHIIGIVVLVIGLSIGVKYAIDKELISVAARIALTYGAGIVLFIIARVLRKKFKLFSSILFSGSMATFYFTTYAAYTYYDLFPLWLTFALMFVITLYTAYTATTYDRQEIGLLGMVGAYGIPFLISANSEKAEMLFAYTSFINMGVIILSVRKSWKEMSQLAQIVTWTLFIGWLYTRFKYDLSFIATIILCVFYAMFLINAFFFRSKEKNELPKASIQMIAINNLALYVSLLGIYSFSAAGFDIAGLTIFTSLIMTVFVAIVYSFFKSEKLLQKTLVLQSITLYVVFVVYNWDGLIVTLILSLMASVLFTIGLFFNQLWLRLTAVILMTFTLSKLVLYDIHKFTVVEKVISFVVIGSLLLIISFLYQKLKK